MTPVQILIILGVGLVAGWLASLVVGGGGPIQYIIWGVLGAVVGGVVFPALGITVNLGHPLLSSVAVAAGGAIVVVILARLIA